MSATSSSLFNSLPTRPPTPPREIANAIDDAISFLGDSNEVEQLLSKSAGNRSDINTSELTPSSSQDTTTLVNLSKKVGFSPHPTYFKVSRPDQSSSPALQRLKRSPSSAKDAKPLKSILKPSHTPLPTPEDLETNRITYFCPAEPGSFGKMLQSVCTQLDQPSRSFRLDAYITLNGALKAYEDVPDTAAMVQKMRHLMRFLSRDIICKNSSGALDEQVIGQALKLTVTILFHRDLSDALDDDFRFFLLDRSIAALEQSEIPKSIVRMHMVLLSQQQFRQPVMTAGRADRILTALQTIEDRCSGNTAVSTRLSIYKRLLEQTPAVMLTRIRDWLEQVFHGMLSSIADVRFRAIDACTQAGLSLGQQPHAGKALNEMFETEVEEGQTYCDYLKARLLQMISEDDIGPYVPQIWAAVILFFRSKRMPLDRWAPFKSSWLVLIQRCLNASNISVRYQATLAWNKLVFAVMPDGSTSAPLMRMLTVPITSGLDKRGADKQSKQIRQFALDSYYNLLHYGLRPGLSTDDLDYAWDELILALLPNMLKSSSKGLFIACQVLHGLLKGNNGVWNSNAAFATTAIKPEDLPKLDPKWVRSRLSKFVNILEPAILATMWSPSQAAATLNATWLALMQSIAEARSQEVKTTADLKEAIASSISLLRRIWTNIARKPEEVDADHWIKRYVVLVDAVIKGIGQNPFTEDILTTNSNDTIEVAPTPSHRPSKHHSAPISPMSIIMGQFYHPPAESMVDEAYFESALAILRIALSDRASSTPSLDLLSRSLFTWNNTGAEDPLHSVKQRMWGVVADMTVELLEHESQRTTAQDSRPFGQTLRSSLEIFVAGLDYDTQSHSPSIYTKLYDSLEDAAKLAAGDGGIVIALMEPLSKALLETDSRSHSITKLQVATRMLECKTWPKQRQALETARKALWRVGLTPIKTSAFEPFEHVYNVITTLLRYGYHALEDLPSKGLEALASFFGSVVGFIESSPSPFPTTTLRKVQTGFTVWIEDDDSKTAANEKVTDMIRTGWKTLIQLLRSVPSQDSTMLKALEPLLVAGFRSPHKFVVNDTIAFWNETFGTEEVLEYPEKLQTVLRARLADAEINLPTFPDSAVDDVPAALPAFYDSESQDSVRPEPPKMVGSVSRGFLSPMAQIPGLSGNRPSSSRSLDLRKTASPSPARRPHSSSSSTPKPRLRHDDSQIQFAPINSSPLQPADESQLLTEHQREVAARQQLDAQIFPDLSSSPVAKSSALARGLPKRLDFGSKASPRKDDTGFGTPTGLPDGNGLASDDMPSSPTPSSNKDASQGTNNAEDEQEEEAAAFDPPSSPPRTAEDEDKGMEGMEAETHSENHDETTVVDPPALPEPQHDMFQAEAQEGQTDKQDQDDAVDDMVSAPEYPSSSQLRDDQFELAQEAAPPNQADNIQQGASAGAEAEEDTQAGASQEESNETEVSMVEDSFVRPVSQDGSQLGVDDSQSQSETQSQSQSQGNSPESQKSGTKRKRKSSSKLFTARKRKQQSPLQRVWSTLGFGQREDEEDDDDIGEDIIVASSQPKPSPEPRQATGTDDAQSEAVDSSVPVKKEAEAPQPPPKRGRGRPRKSETPTPNPNPSQTETSTSRSLKRKASVLSNASVESQKSSSFVKDTPAPRPRRSLRRDSTSQDSEQAVEASSSQRPLSAVVVSPPRNRRRSQAQDEGATPHKQPEEEQTAAVNERNMLTPRSILARLKGALSDFKGMILGPQEEREFDDVLFEFRRETHEASRRGRQMQ